MGVREFFTSWAILRARVRQLASCVRYTRRSVECCRRSAMSLKAHMARPISSSRRASTRMARSPAASCERPAVRSEEHTSELQSLRHLVCRLLLEKKKVLNNHSAVVVDYWVERHLEHVCGLN